jgi:hypothetical protein
MKRKKERKKDFLSHSAPCTYVLLRLFQNLAQSKVENVGRGVVAHDGATALKTVSLGKRES